MKKKFKELYFQVTFNRMVRIERNLGEFLAGVNTTKNKKELVALKRRFREIKKDFKIVTSLKAVVFVLMYFSIISLFAKSIPFLSELTSQVAYFSGFLSLPLLTIFLLILEKASNVLIVDAQFVVTRIITLFTK